MKKSFPASIAVIPLLLLLVQLTGCGLKYTPPQTLESIEEDRRFALQEQLHKDFSSIGKKYTPLTYGEPMVVKPDSYRKLDSLYGVKYRNVQKRPDLEQQISRQQAIIGNDTTPVLYVETHWYELAQDSTFEYLTSEISMKKDNSIAFVKNLDYFQTSKKYAPYARIFMKEESLLSPGMQPSDNEISFYTAYKTKASTLKGAAKDDFLAHTFQLMESAKKLATLSTEALLRKITGDRISKDFLLADPALLKFTVEEISDTSSGKPVFQYYLVTATENGPKEKEPFVYKYSAYLEHIQ